MVGSIASFTLILLAIIYRPLVLECFDPGFLRAVGGRGSLYHVLFLLLVVLNLVAGFQALGTLMAVGMMMLPATAARFWTHSLSGLMVISTLLATLSGLIVSYHLGVASGPAIVLTASAFYGISLLFGRTGIVRRLFPKPHLAH